MRSESTSQRLVIEVKISSAPAPAKSFDWLTLLPAALAVVVAIIGWRIVEGYARAREKRADLRAAVSSVASSITEIAASATAFYKLDGGSAQARALATTIRAKFGALPQVLAVLRAGGLEIAADAELKLFRQAVTGDTFDSLTREPSPDNAAVFVSIANAGETLNRSIQLSLYRSFVTGSKRSKGNQAQPVSPPN